MKEEIKYLRRPRVHYCLCLRNWSYKSREMSSLKLCFSLVLTYEFWFVAIVIVDVAFTALWIYIYIFYFTQILMKAESTDEVEMIKTSEDFINFFFGFIKVDGSVIII